MWFPEVLVLGPGGMEGFLELGLLHKFQNIKFLDKVHTYIGCSAGSIISLLLVAGFTIPEIIEEARDFNLFQDISSIKLNDFKSLFFSIKDNFGLLDHNVMRQRLNVKLRSKLGTIPTLYQLYLFTNITYISVTYNLTKDETEYFSWKTHPDILATDASILSMNIPILFHKLRFRECVYIDGAFGDPYPIKYLDDGKTNILGVHIPSDNPQREKKDIAENEIRYLNKVLHASMTQLYKNQTKAASSHVKHIILYSPTIDITGITYTNETKKEMILTGYQEAIKFLKTINCENALVLSDIAEMSNIQALLDDEEYEEEEEGEGEGEGEREDEGSKAEG